MLVCFTRKEGKLMVKRELENLKLIYEIRNQEGCTVIHWKIKFYSENSSRRYDVSAHEVSIPCLRTLHDKVHGVL